jgi:hypothetical protein
MAQVLRSDERAWRDLAEAASSPGGRAGDLLRLVKATAGRVIPAGSNSDQAAFAALQSLARAYAVARPDRRERLDACLRGLASECAAAVGWREDAARLSLARRARPAEKRPVGEGRDLFDLFP